MFDNKIFGVASCLSSSFTDNFKCTFDGNQMALPIIGPNLDIVGSMKFAFHLIHPFESDLATLTGIGTYWKALVSFSKASIIIFSKAF